VQNQTHGGRTKKVRKLKVRPDETETEKTRRKKKMK
jgi:hypothetical protein